MTTPPARTTGEAPLLTQAYAGVTALLGGLDEVTMGRGSRCTGWTVVDVLAHLLGDAQRALMAAASPVDAAPSVDASGYWRAWQGDADPVRAARGARFVRVQASAYRGPRGLLAQWRDTAEAAVRAVGARAPGETVATQGHLLTVADLTDTLVVEAVVHQLDCLLDLPDAPAPAPAALAAARGSMAALADTVLPADDDAGWVLRGSGRLPLRAEDRELLGDAAARFPLLG